MTPQVCELRRLTLNLNDAKCVSCTAFFYCFFLLRLAPRPCFVDRKRCTPSFSCAWGVGTIKRSRAHVARPLLVSHLRLCVFVSTCSCAPRVFRRASQGPQGRVVPFGGARQGPDRRLRTAVQQRRPGRVPRFIGAYSSSPHTVPLCLGVRGPALRNCVASRVV